MAHSIKRIRTMALVGQAGSGKTTLAEALLAKAGAVAAAGQRRARHHRLRLRPAGKAAAALAEARGRELRGEVMASTRIHLLDTPGYPDFLGQAMPALAAVETAAIVINAQNGIEMMTPPHDAVGGEARARPPDHRQQDRRRERRSARRCSSASSRRSARNACRSTCRPASAARSPTASSRRPARPTSPRSRRRTAGSSSRWSRSTRS